MDRIRAWFRRKDEEYEPLTTSADGSPESTAPTVPTPTFSWLEYSIFVLLGVSMLWAWNMFLAAGPYLEQRFRGNDWIARNFQAVELSISNVGNLGVMFVLTKMQRGASYPRRIFMGLVINTLVFGLLAVSTKIFTGISASAYFGFVMAMVFSASVSTGLFQNGIFAYVSGFGQSSYTQGIMVGQGIAGVLPCIAQIVLVLGLSSSRDDIKTAGDMPGAVPEAPPVPSSAALAYFLTAVAISAATFSAFSLLVRRRATQRLKADIHAEHAPGLHGERSASKSVPMLVLARKLLWPAMTVFITFVITMQFPVYTQKIVSVVPVDKASRILYPPSFIPLAFLFWNAGDLIGRILTAFPKLLLTRRPHALFVLGLARLIWIPLYQLCNIRGRGAVISSDFFYLVVVQLLFGISSGYIGSSCMMGAGEWVEPEEREAAGGFMGLCLVLGLAVGSFLSFFVSG
ncbi:nucleoside transporter family [Myriangium duriaei CBS 260.36]|uniref:Nucleoside transporter family n=1 Tax=Myriangium duriaei CBS 260.36 TaxID=1168546 RepID=A0A9P4J3K2_9PEZI|nr:nucleoside transporter family [Myriangium duriaei CBS 260.36]